MPTTCAQAKDRKKHEAEECKRRYINEIVSRSLLFSGSA